MIEQDVDYVDLAKRMMAVTPYTKLWLNDDDIVQEFAIQLWLADCSYDGKSSQLGTWRRNKFNYFVSETKRNLAKRFKKSEKSFRYCENVHEPMMMIDKEPFSLDDDSQEKIDAIKNILPSLTNMEKAAIEQYYFTGCKVRELPQKIGCAKSSATNLLMTARNKIKEVLKFKDNAVN